MVGTNCSRGSTATASSLSTSSPAGYSSTRRPCAVTSITYHRQILQAPLTDDADIQGPSGDSFMLRAIPSMILRLSSSPASARINRMAGTSGDSAGTSGIVSGRNSVLLTLRLVRSEASAAFRDAENYQLHHHFNTS